MTSADSGPLDGLSRQERRNLARSSDVDPGTLELLASDSDSAVVRAALSNPLLPVSVMKRVALGSDKRWLLSSLWANPAIPEDVFRLLHLKKVTSGGDPADTLPYTHGNCPPDMLKQGAGSAHARVRAAVAANPGTPADVLRALSTDSSTVVLAALASNEKTPPDVLNRIACNPSSAVVVALLMRSDNFGRALDQDMVRHDSPRVRIAVARMTRDETLLNMLALDGDPLIRSAVLRNPETPASAKVAVALANQD